MIRTLLKEALIATLITITTTVAINYSPIKFDFLNPDSQNFDDFDIYDLYFAGNENVPLKNDTNIVIVQTADLRKEIASQIQEIRQLNPAVVGIDLLFKSKHVFDLSSDSCLANLAKCPNVVPAYKVADFKGKVIDQSIIPKDVLRKQGGYINFVGGKFSVVRSFNPSLTIGNETQSSFDAKITQIFSPSKLIALNKRNNFSEEINYTGNINKFKTFTKEEFKNYYLNCFAHRKFDSLKGKIVLLGVFDKRNLSLEDLKFTPLNPYYSGKSNPDMYGVIIHANIIDMLLENNFIDVPHIWISYFLAMLLCFVASSLLIWGRTKFRLPNHLLIAVVQIIYLVAVLYFSLKLFDWFRIKLILSPVVIAIVLCVEMMEVYRFLALWLKKKFMFNTIFK